MGRSVAVVALPEVLPMHADKQGATPIEVMQLWESWGVAYATRLRFGAGADAEAKWLQAREDAVPPPPAVTRLEGKASILQAITITITTTYYCYYCTITTTIITINY